MVTHDGGDSNDSIGLFIFADAFERLAVRTECKFLQMRLSSLILHTPDHFPCQSGVAMLMISAKRANWDSPPSLTAVW